MLQTKRAVFIPFPSRVLLYTASYNTAPVLRLERSTGLGAYCGLFSLRMLADPGIYKLQKIKIKSQITSPAIQQLAGDVIL